MADRALRLGVDTDKARAAFTRAPVFPAVQVPESPAAIFRFRAPSPPRPWLSVGRWLRVGPAA